MQPGLTSFWEKAGKPEGRDEEFWHLAEQELLNEDRGARRYERPTRFDRSYDPRGAPAGPYEQMP
ncbi:DUF2934 domain-containing protein [Bradyrhizobium jicamae]|uniref:DUF2934 domain-containing protein n=1 Tax=Bradyrhizobium jicamae TaxID=280332 RepID=UPI00390C824D